MAFAEIPNHILDGPIPGENYTSDVKNYPWHRPPEFTEPDEAIEYLAKIMTDENGSFAIIGMLEAGIDVLSIAHMIIMKGIGSGKWSVDLGLLLAGPIAHIVILMARGYDLDYDIGFSGPPKGPTSVFFREAKRVDRQKAKEAGKEARTGGEIIKELASAGFLQTVDPDGEDEGSEGPDSEESAGFMAAPSFSEPADGGPDDMPDTEEML